MIWPLDITKETTNDFLNDTEVPSKNQRHTYDNIVQRNEETMLDHDVVIVVSISYTATQHSTQEKHLGVNH